MTKAFKVNITAPAIIKDGGTSTQYLMADGSVSTGGSGVKYTYASTPPSSPTAGDIWVDSGDGTEYTYVADGDSNQWVELSNAGLPGPTGATGSSGTVVVNSPILNTGTSTSAILSLDTTIVPRLTTPNTFTASPQQININSSSNNGLIIKAASSQTADIQQWQDSSSNTLSKITYDGSAYFANGFSAGKNKVLNSDFLIWQRGTSFSANGYTADRWNVSGASGQTVSVSQQTFTPGTAPVAGYEGTYFARVAFSGTPSGTYWFNQKIEDVRTFAGQTVTLSFWAKASSNTSAFAPYIEQNFGSGGSTFVPATTWSTISLTTSWQRFSMTATLPSVSGKTIGTGSFLDVRPLNGSSAVTGNNIDIWGVQLEAGSVATPFTTSTGTIAGELAACQRYYVRFTGATSTGQYGVGLTASTTSASCYINLPVPMRINPNVNAIDNNSLQILDRVAAAAYNSTAIVFGDGVTNQFVELTVTISGATAGRFVILRNTTSAGYLGFSAEL